MGTKSQQDTEEIRFAVGVSALGHVLVARSAKGLCAVLLGDDPEALRTELRGRFPRAALTGDGPGLEGLAARVARFVDAPGEGLDVLLDVPLDLRGTAFQQAVWQALREVPAGATTSYTALARNIGQPSAVRAVAGACAANPLAVLVPCHRVLRSDGALSGYRWGVERKRALLDREAAGPMPGRGRR